MTRRLIAASLGAGLALRAGLSPSIAYADAPASRVAAVSEAVETADFDSAEKLAHQLLASSQLSREQAALMYLELGLVYCARLNGDAADDTFRTALALEPKLELPRSAGPHVIEAFAKAKAASAVPNVSITLAASKDRPELDVDASVSSDDRHLARTLVLSWSGGSETRPVGAAKSHFTIPIPVEPGSACTAVSAAVADEYGNVLWPALARASVCPAPAARRQPEAKPHRPVPAQVWVAASVTVAATAATTVLGVIALDQRASFQRMNGDPTVSVSDRAEQRSDALSAEHRATAAGVITALSAAATIVLYLTRPEGNVSRSSLGPAVAVASF